MSSILSTLSKGLAIGALFAGAGVAAAQDYTGEYVFNGPQGAVHLTLRQQGTSVLGEMRGLDGSSWGLQGTITADGTTGQISFGQSQGWFALGFVGARLKMVVAEVDAAGQPDLASGWELDFVRTGAGSGAGAGPGLGSAVGGGSPGTGGAPGPGGVAPQREDTQLLREWLAHLRGKRLTYMESYASGGGSGGFSDKWEADLCSDGTFYFRSRSMVSADVGGVGGYSASSGGMPGMWRLVEQGGQVVLQYRMQDGTEDQALLGYQDGKTYFGNQRVYVTQDNSLCR